MISLRLLGGLSIARDSGPITGAAAQPVRLALLAVLAVAEPRPVSRDKLVGLLWPDTDSARGRRNLSDALYALRQKLGEEAIVATGDALRLNPDAVDVDVAAFERALELGAAREGVAIYEGPFLDGVHLRDTVAFERWVDEHRNRLSRAYREALESLARAAEEAGDAREAVSWRRALVAEQPFSTAAVIALMRALERAGDPAAALEAGHLHAERLHEELDAEPDPRLEAELERIRTSPEDGELPLPPVSDRARRPSEAASVEISAEAAYDLPAGSGGARQGASSPTGRRVSGRAVAAGIVVAAAVGALFLLVPRSEPPAAEVDLERIAVFPPVPMATDTALSRLGKELAVTLSASLDGIGEIRTTPALTVLANADEAALSPEDGARVARRLGAGSALHGSLLRSGEDVRLDVVLYRVEDLQPLAEATVEGPADDIAALTDSASLALLRPIWDDGPAPTPSLSELTTASVPALRAYLEGEAAYARGAYPEAVAAYERAFAEDSTFWFAYWRSLYPRSHAGSPPDSEALATVFEHRDELPERERLLMESYRVKSLRDRIAVLLRLTERFPDYWPGWWEYAEELTHRGPYVGATHRETRRALERTLALNPGFAEGWEHLFWIAVLERDSARVSRSRAQLERFAAPGAFRFNSDMLPYLRALEEVLRAGGEFGEGGADRIARAILAMHAGGAPIRTEALATGFVSFGFPRAQLQLADAILAEGATGELAAAQAWGRALSWAVRGAWSEALAEADRWAAESALPTAGLRAYGLATVGAWMGAVSPQAAAERRDVAVISPAARSPEGRAELAWLDGVLAYLRNDEPGLARAIETLQTGGAASLGRLRRSLVAFRRDMGGDRKGAARTLAALEEESSWGLDSRYRPDQQPPRHPNLSAVNRLASARWLLEIGDTARAERLLTWHQAIGPMDQAELINRTAEPLAILERARIAESRGREEESQKLYAAFLERYDMPPDAHVSWVEEARGALRRLSAGAESGS